MHPYYAFYFTHSNMYIELHSQCAFMYLIHMHQQNVCVYYWHTLQFHMHIYLKSFNT